MTGTTPPGVRGEEQTARWVRDMFSQIAPRYDLLNHLLSFNIDRTWRARVARRVSHILQRPDARVLDLCCGTGDLMLALQERSPARILGSDFCHPMLVSAASKSGNRAPLFEADALHLPLADGALDLVTMAFGFRNLANYEKGLAELRRVVRPGGTIAILEFSQPPNAALAAAYGFYSRNIPPRLGAAISGSNNAYEYLPESVRKFPGAEGLANAMRAAGFENVHFERMTFGVVTLHLAETQ